MRRELVSKFIGVELNIGGVLRKFDFKFAIDSDGVTFEVSGYKKQKFIFDAWDFEKVTRALYFDSRSTRLCNTNSRARS